MTHRTPTRCLFSTGRDSPHQPPNPLNPPHPLQTLESHVNEELGKWVDEEGGVNAFGIQVLREDGQGQTVRPLLPGHLRPYPLYLSPMDPCCPLSPQ